MLNRLLATIYHLDGIFQIDADKMKNGECIEEIDARTTFFSNILLLFSLNLV